MTEEEKKAIETLKSWKDYNIRNKNKLLEANKIIKVQETILNLIEKLQKENNKLNIKLDDKEAEIQILKDDIKADDIEYKHVIEILKKENEEYSKQLDLDYVDKNYISKQEIKDKIEEIEEKMKHEYNRIILVQLFKQRKVLKELLEGRK